MDWKQSATAAVASVAIAWGASTVSFADEPLQESTGTEQVAFQAQVQEHLTRIQEQLAKLNQDVAELQQQKVGKRVEPQGRTAR
jgi:peptidoglycan hydrolase CwlO-like protein